MAVAAAEHQTAWAVMERHKACRAVVELHMASQGLPLAAVAVAAHPVLEAVAALQNRLAAAAEVYWYPQDRSATR